MTRSDFNNNPGNLRPPPGVKYEGMIGVDDKGFAIFENKEFGRRALINDINKKISDGLNSPDKFINKYAPASEENPELSRDNYKISLAMSLGLTDTSAEFPKNSAEKIANAITKFEGTSEPAASVETSDSEETSGSEKSLEQKVKDVSQSSGKILQDVKKFATDFAEQNPEEARLGLDIAGGLAGKSLGRGLESLTTAYSQKARQLELDESRKARAAMPAATPPEQAASRKIPGASGASNWTRVMGKDIPFAIAESAENMRADNPKGAQYLIDKDTLAKQKLIEMGLDPKNYPLTPHQEGQLQVPREIAEEREAARIASEQAKKPGVLARNMPNIKQSLYTGMRAFPGFTGALSGVAATDLAQQSYQRASEGDIPAAAIYGLGSAGALASLLPFPQTKFAGSIIAAASPLTALLYDKLKDRTVSQAQGFKSLAEGKQLPPPSIYSPYER
jgi:hypothetical protein